MSQTIVKETGDLLCICRINNEMMLNVAKTNALTYYKCRIQFFSNRFIIGKGKRAHIPQVERF